MNAQPGQRSDADVVNVNPQHDDRPRRLPVESPFKQLESMMFVARWITLGWDKPNGHERYELSTSKPGTYTKDRRVVIVTSQNISLWMQLTASDPRIPRMMRLEHDGESREVLPPIEIPNLNQLLNKCYVPTDDTIRAYDMNEDELDHLKNRNLFDELYEFGADVPMHKRRDIIRAAQQAGGNDWPERARTALAAYGKPETDPVEDKPVNVKTNDLDEHIVRDADNQPAATTTERNYGRLWIRMNELYDLYTMPAHMDYDKHEHIHVLLGLRPNGSLKELGDATDNSIFMTLKPMLDKHYTLKAASLPETAPVAAATPSEPIARPTTPPIAERPVSGEIVSVDRGNVAAFPNWPESPVVVYPMANGSVIYKGIRFSVTLRVGGTFLMAKELMIEFAEYKELIDPSCVVRAVPMQSAATGGSAAPRDEDAPPLDDDETFAEDSGTTQHEDSTWISREFAGGKAKYIIGYNAGDKETRFPLEIKTPAAVKMLEQRLRDLKVNPDKMVDGKRYVKPRLRVTWKQGKEFAPGKHYRDFSSFDPIAATEDEAIPA